MTAYGGLSPRLLLLVIGVLLLEAGLIAGLAIALVKRRRTDRALRESESRFRIVADSAPVLIWMSGVDRLCTFFNKPWLEFTGRTAEQEMGNGWADGVHADELDPCMNIYSAAFDSRERFSMEYRLRRYDGEYRWVLDEGVPRFSKGGRFEGYIGFLRYLLSSEYAALKDRIHFLENVSDGQLKTLYQSCSAFVTMSEHEGFCVPLVEAMICDTPIVAYSSTAIPYTLGDAGIQFREKDYTEIAGICHKIKEDSNFKNSILESQRKQLQKYSMQEIEKSIDSFLSPLL